MKVLNTIVALSLFAFSFSMAHAQLPPEVQAKLLDRKIATKIQANDLSSVEQLIGEYKSIGVEVPVTYYFMEAKIAGARDDFSKAKSALEQFFQSASTTHQKYDAALDLYETFEQEMQEQNRKQQSGFDVIGSLTKTEGKDWLIQVGQFESLENAISHLETLTSELGLSRDQAEVHAVKRSDDTRYLARFARLNIETANASCKKLNSQCWIVTDSQSSEPLATLSQSGGVKATYVSTKNLSDEDYQELQFEVGKIREIQSQNSIKTSGGSSSEKKHSEQVLDGVAYTTYVMDRGDPCTIVPKRKFVNLELIETAKIWYIINSKKTRSGKFRSGIPYRATRSPGIYNKGDPVTYSYEHGHTTIGDGHAKLCTYKVTDFKSTKDLSEFRSQFANGITFTEAKNKALDDLKKHSSVYTSLKSACDAISNWKYYNDNAHCTGGLK